MSWKGAHGLWSAPVQRSRATHCKTGSLVSTQASAAASSGKRSAGGRCASSVLQDVRRQRLHRRTAVTETGFTIVCGGQTHALLVIAVGYRHVGLTYLGMHDMAMAVPVRSQLQCCLCRHDHQSDTLSRRRWPFRCAPS